MNGITVIARRRADGTLEHGWIGTDGSFEVTGRLLEEYYSDARSLDYLFSLGQLTQIGKPGSAGQDEPLSLKRMGIPYIESSSEADIFENSPLIDCAYLYDLDQRWHWLKPGPFITKIPLSLIMGVKDRHGDAYGFLQGLDELILQRILIDLPQDDPELASIISNHGSLYERLKEDEHPLETLAKEAEDITDYLDRWIVISADTDGRKIADISIQKRSETHTETIYRGGAIVYPPSPRYINPYVRSFTIGSLYGMIGAVIETREEGTMDPEIARELMLGWGPADFINTADKMWHVWNSFDYMDLFYKYEKELWDEFPETMEYCRKEGMEDYYKLLDDDLKLVNATEGR